MNRIAKAKPDVHLVTLVKDSGERFVFMFDADHKDETLRTMGRFASNPDIEFSWYDAAVLSQKVRAA